MARTISQLARMFSIALVLAAGTAAVAAADQWTKSYPVQGVPDLHLTTDDGSVVVETWNQDVVGVTVTTARWRIGSNGVKIDESRSGNRIDLSVLRHNRRHWNFGFEISTGKSLEIKVSLPRNSDLAVQSGDGSLRIAPLAGHISLRTGDGSIDARGLKGAITLASGDGSILATDLDGTLNAHTGDGTIRVAGRFDALDLTSGDGHVRLEAATGSKIGDGWSIETGDGPIDVRIPDTLNADLDAHTGDGAIHLDIPVRVEGRFSTHNVRGSINSGGPPLRIRTGDGSIRLGAL